jgi:hypothetical protein
VLLDLGQLHQKVETEVGAGAVSQGGGQQVFHFAPAPEAALGAKQP